MSIFTLTVFQSILSSTVSGRERFSGLQDAGPNFRQGLIQTHHYHWELGSNNHPFWRTVLFRYSNKATPIHNSLRIPCAIKKGFTSKWTNWNLMNWYLLFCGAGVIKSAATYLELVFTAKFYILNSNDY